MNLRHPRWDETRTTLMAVFFLITIFAWMLAFTEMPWWWAFFPTGIWVALAWWEVAAMKYPPLPPLPPDPPPHRPRLP